MSETEEPSYERKVLYGNKYFEVVSCTWKKGDHSPLHSHHFSQCYTLVEDGIFENLTDSGFKREIQTFEKDQIFITPPAANHSIRCISLSGQTLHVYVPKIAESPRSNRFKPISAETLRETLDISLSNEGVRWEQLLLSLKNIENHSVNTDTPFFMNQLFSGVLPEMLASEDVIARARTTMATFESSPAFSLVEAEVVKELVQLIGWEKGEGIGVPGGSAANFMAIHCARHRKFPEFKTKGMGAQKMNLFLSEEAHYSFKKGCAALGLGTDALITVKCDSKGRMNLDDLQIKIQQCLAKGSIPLMVAATAGTTVYGAFDPIEELAKICHQHSIWLHVDGAWGGPALFSNSARALLRGIEKADSFTFDAHKLLGANLTCSFFLTSDTRVLLEANDVSGADYLFHNNGGAIDRGRMSWQCGRRADALSFWTLWKSQGREGIGEFIDRLLEVQKQTVQWIQKQDRLELKASPDFLNICVAVTPPKGLALQEDWSIQVRTRLRENNQVMVNYSKDSNGLPFLRLVLANPRITFETIRQILEWALEVDSGS